MAYCLQIKFVFLASSGIISQPKKKNFP
jgi:hypothetical protein